MVLVDVKNKITISSTQKLEETETGQTIISNFLSLCEDYTEEEMDNLLQESQNNHFWTQEEKMCLVYFGEKCDMNFKSLHEDRFPGRSVVALKGMYKKMLKGEDTPASTPRFSISNSSKKVGNKLNSFVKLLTPSSTPMKNNVERRTLEEINEEEDECLFDDDSELVLEEEEIQPVGEEEEQVEEEDEPEVEEAEKEEELVEDAEEEEEVELETEAEEFIQEGDDLRLNCFFGIAIPMMVLILFTLLIVNMPVENLGEKDSLLNQYRGTINNSWSMVQQTLEEFMKKMF